MGGVPSKADPSKTLQVIGAGYARTGTVSMQMALERLLDGPVCHGATHVFSREADYLKKWIYAWRARRAGDRETTLKLVRELSAGYVGCTDIPNVMFTRELLDIYPEAKVVLVTRDPARWWKSFQPVLANCDAWFLPYLSLISKDLQWFPPMLKEWKMDCDELCERTGRKKGDYGPWLVEEYNKQITEMVPKERLLVMTIDQGWEPLCKFLNKPVPDEPFPRANDAEAADKFAAIMFGKMALQWLATVGAAGGSLYLAWYLWRM